MTTWGHIAERFFIHVFASGSVYMLAFFGMRFFRRKNAYWHALIVPALIAAGFIGWREAFDVARDGELKSVFDYISWSLGLGLAAWGVHRIRNVQIDT